ncbi:MAG: methylated-DNA--[protein]-cysteine S-methyltransferase [Thermoanaerobacteraceae bacterium]
MLYKTIATPIGILTIFSTGKGIYRINFENENINLKNSHHKGEDLYINEVIAQLDLYFRKKLKVFNLTLDLHGTDFQKRVWEEVLKIPYGTVTTYSDIAYRIGNSKASRAVGQALNKNPIPIIIPCHRVVGKNKDLTGYRGGLNVKKFLLNLEVKVII